MNKPTYINLLNECINYAMNELTISNSSIDMVEAVDETVLRLKIIYEISPCVLDQLNDYDKFKSYIIKVKNYLILKCSATWHRRIR